MPPYSTPDAAVGETVCRVLVHDAAFSEEINHQLGLLEQAYSWRDEGGMTVSEVQHHMRLMIDNLREGGCAVYGQIIATAAATVPDDWLLCDGSSYPEDQYPELAAALGAAWSTGGFFSVPDLRGRAVIGVGNAPSLSNRAMGDTGGQEQHTLTVAEMPAHTHGYIQSPISDIDLEDVGIPQPAVAANVPAVTDPEGGGGAHENMPPFLALTWLIYSGRAAY